MLRMNAPKACPVSLRRISITTAVAATFLWFAQPPVCFWPLGFVALVPFIDLIEAKEQIQKRGYLAVWVISSCYFLLSLQGLRHAHPAMVFPWLALGGYLAVYHVAFIAVARQLRSSGLPLVVAIPLVWVTQECVRNYLLTGISAIMLGHIFADVPSLIQIADLFGSYGVSAVAAGCSVAVWQIEQCVMKHQPPRMLLGPCGVAGLLLVSSLAYGAYRLSATDGPPLATFALVQRSEPVEYGQSLEREQEIFRSYARQSIEIARTAGKPIDAFVWPESMFTGGMPWMMRGDDMLVPQEARMSDTEFQNWISNQQDNFLERTQYVQNAIAIELADNRPPQMIVGCGVIKYDQVPEVYSGVVSLDSDGSLRDWYGKTHLVMFGEYIPLAPSIPGVRSLVPPGMGLQVGPGAKSITVGNTTVSPNICIETAVERVTLQHLKELYRKDGIPDVVVTVTNDGWFDDSSVIEHHLRCAQFVAVACRRPLLSAANNGPTAWIDSRGRLVQRLTTGVNGAILATPLRDTEVSLAVRIGDWPARIVVMLCVLLLIKARFQRHDFEIKEADPGLDSDSSANKAVVNDTDG